VDRPAGAPGDVIELEYCSALRQTDTSRSLRRNGSLTAQDVRLHLISRHGVKVSVERIRESILIELAGGQEYVAERGGEGGEEEESAMASASRGSSGRGRGGNATVTSSLSGMQSIKSGKLTSFFMSDKSGTSSKEDFNEITPLDMVQQTALLLIPELRRTYVEKQMDEIMEQQAEQDIPNEGISGEDGIVDDKVLPSAAFSSSIGDRTAKDDNSDNSDKRRDVLVSARRLGSGTSTSPAGRSSDAHLGDRSAIDEASLEENIPDPNLKTMSIDSEPNGPDSKDGKDVGGESGRIEPPGKDVRSSDVSGITGLRCDSDVDASHDIGAPKRSAHGDGESELSNNEEDLSSIEPSLLVILQEAGLEYGVELTFDVMRTILEAFGEDQWPDEVVHEMVAQASGSASKRRRKGDDGDDEGSTAAEIPILDVLTFLRALTADTAAYDLAWDDRVSTFWQDINSDPNSNETDNTKETMIEVGEADEACHNPPPIHRMFTGDSIDFTSDSYASFSWTILVWFAVVLAFFSYLFRRIRTDVQRLPCATNAPDPASVTFGCIVADAIVSWLVIFVVLTILGFVFLFLSTLGNSMYLTEWNKSIGVAAIFVSMAVVAFATMVTYGYSFRTSFASTEKDQDFRPLYITTLVVGCILVVLQIQQLVRTLVPGFRFAYFLDRFSTSATRLEKQTKQGARFKVSRMVKNALECHTRNADEIADHPGIACASKSSTTETRLAALNVHGYISKALSNYNSRIATVENIGGVWWSICNFWFGSSIVCEEGIVVFPRLLWANLTQAAVCIFLFYMWVYIAELVGKQPDPVMAGLSRRG